MAQASRWKAGLAFGWVQRLRWLPAKGLGAAPANALQCCRPEKRIIPALPLTGAGIVDRVAFV